MLGSVRLERRMEVSTTAKARGRLLIENCCLMFWVFIVVRRRGPSSTVVT